MTYAYDHLGRRIEKQVNDGQSTVTTQYAYDGWRVIAEYDGQDTLLRKYIYGVGIDEPLALIVVDGQNETWYYYHVDGLGNVVALSDTDGDIVESYAYTAFGGTKIFDEDGGELSSSAVGDPFRFTGRRYETETGLYYYRHRYYDPTLGRFLQTDPIGYAAGMNLFAYCGNNPINWTDPLGLYDYREPHPNGGPSLLPNTNSPISPNNPFPGLSPTMMTFHDSVATQEIIKNAISDVLDSHKFVLGNFLVAAFILA